MEKSDLVDQKIAEVKRLLASRPDIFLRQGTVVESWREYRGRRLGPYFRLAYRDGNRQGSVYLGRSVQLADAVRTLLNEQHRDQVNQRQLRRLQASARAELRKIRRRWAQDLRQFGLYLHGSEIRGWRGRQPACPDGNRAHQL